jgi:hypothetical protein
MLEEIRDRLDLVLLVNVSPSEEDVLKKGNKDSICISHNSTNAVDRDPAQGGPGFQSLEDFQIVTKRRADLVFFGSNTSRLVMGAVICNFLQSDGIIVVDAASGSISRGELAMELAALGCGDGRVLTLRRLPGMIALGYDVGADVVTRVSGKLAGEFFEALGRVAVGAEVVVDDVFEKPEDVVGPYFIVAVEGAEFDWRSSSHDQDLVAVDLSASGIRALPDVAFL